MSAHTGPWRLHEPEFKLKYPTWTISDAHGIVCNIGPSSSDYKEGLKLTPADEANARLIAAAPDLLAALQAILAGSPDYCPPDEVWVAAEKAIAKATGKETP